MKLLKNHLSPVKGKIIALGFFDGVHSGHRAVLRAASQEAKKRNKSLEVITFYPHPRNFITRSRVVKYLTPYSQKFLLFKSFFPESTLRFWRFDNRLRFLSPGEFIDILDRIYHPSAVFVGANYRFGFQASGNTLFLKEELNKRGIEVEIVPPVKFGDTVISSSLIRSFLEQGFVEKANSALGYPFFIIGKTRPGARIGQKLGFPTGNIYPPSQKKLPRAGVYAGVVESWDQEIRQPALVYCGTKPSVLNKGKRRVIEFFMPDLAYRELYNQRFLVYLWRFLRPEITFPSLSELKQQILRDTEHLKQYLHQYPAVVNYHLNVTNWRCNSSWY
ncbi:MAG: riboflavin kinase / adenylyltransferase [Candidatus Atribacteria bacterium]|nr:riboflavin kinase / adenylyltransferase [Candidatus Atribacteria bacterium]